MPPLKSDPASPVELTLDVRAGESYKEAVLRVLRAEILSGELAPGQKLSEARLAKRFGLSRMPVREALIELDRADLVSIESKRGTFVKRITQREAMDLFDVREALESLAARLCAQRANSAVIDELEEIAADMAATVEADDHERYIQLDGRFHSLIFSGSDNTRLHDHYELLITHLHRELLSSIAVRHDGRMRRSYEEHLEIISAIRLRNDTLAESVMKRHVQHGKRELGEAMNAADRPDPGPVAATR